MGDMTEAARDRSDEAPASSGASWLTHAFRDEELAGLRMATLGRTVSLLVIAVLLPFLTIPAVLYYEILLVIFMLIGLAHYALAVSGRSRPWHAYVIIFAEMALLTFTLAVPNPFSPLDVPPQTLWRFNNFIYFFVLLAAVAFSYRTSMMLWAGFCGAVGWVVVSVWMALRPDTLLDHGETTSGDEFLLILLDPYFFDIGVRAQEIVVFLLVAGMLALVVMRSRRLVGRQVAAARERANLSRYFAPGIVEELANKDNPFDVVREQPVAVMFVDIVGFTHLAEELSPEQVIMLLRDYHERMGRAIFDHGGTLDKFLGDGVMATFGTPEAGSRDAADAIACARAIVGAVDAWNEERHIAGVAPIKVSVGLHYGPAVLGDVGSESRLEFAILGDTVNVASRLEALTRSLDCRIAVSEEVIAAVRAQADNDGELVNGFRDMGRQHLAGRAREIAVWGAD